MATKKEIVIERDKALTKRNTELRHLRRIVFDLKNSRKLANEIYNAIRVQGAGVDEYLPFLIEDVVRYHMNPNKAPRENCSWGCVNLDENSPEGWYDGTLCPTCGYVRGMGKQQKGTQ